MSDGIAERVVRRAISHLANSYGHAPAKATAAKEMLVHALEGGSDEPTRSTVTPRRPRWRRWRTESRLKSAVGSTG